MQGFGRVWWLTSGLEIIEIPRNKIMFVETLHFSIMWGVQPFRFFARASRWTSSRCV